MSRVQRTRNTHIARLVLLSLSLAGLAGCGVVVRQVHDTYQKVSSGSLVYQGRIGPLDDREKQWAKTAWRYFVNNTNKDTGLVNAMDSQPSATMWHVGDYLSALHAARQLGLIDAHEFDQRLSRLLRFLSRMDLARDRLPNRYYHTLRGTMVNGTGQLGESGWSSRDISRLLVWLRIIGESYPEFREYTDKVVLRWNLCEVMDGQGNLYRGYLRKGEWQREREGLLGNEEYAAQGFALWGFAPLSAALASPASRINMEGQTLLVDARPATEAQPVNALVSQPYWLWGLEFGWRPRLPYNPRGDVVANFSLVQQAGAVYKVQEQRWLSKRIMTARTDHVLGSPPYLLQDAIYANGYAWNTVNDEGKWFPDLALVSTRAVFGMWVLWDTHYTDQLIKVVEQLYDKDKGWFEGRYEVSGAQEESLSLSTNAMVLESLLYKSSGVIAPAMPETGYFETSQSSYFDLPGKGMPRERANCPPSGGQP